MSLREEKTFSFRWEVERFSSHMDSVVASQSFTSTDKQRWRGVWRKTLFLQLVSAVNPQIVKIRYVKKISFLKFSI